MKLRIRLLESKETLKIESPSPSSLGDLRDAIAQEISARPETLHHSLNRKDEIKAAPLESLSSLGVASGDLIYYTVDPSGFSGRTPPLQAPIPQEVMSPQVQPQETLERPEEETASSSDAMDEDLDDVPIVNSSSSSVPCFLRKVLREEVISPEEYQKILIIAVHAVFLESGYVGFDRIEQQKIDGFGLPLGWASKLASLSLQYTVPSLLGSCCDNGIETVLLKSQVMGKYLNVHGSLSRNGVSLYRLCLDKYRFAPSICFVQTNCDSTGAMDGKDEKGIFEFWKIVKDKLALPLLIDLCVKTGLEPPPCFICLPTDLKLKILELLPGVDIARISCVSSELRFIASHNDLWKHKFTEEFPACNVEGIKRDSWKDKFIVCWERKTSKRRERERRRQRLYIQPGIEPIPFPRGRPRPAPFGFPRIIGDYDLFPAPFGSPRYGNLPARRNFTPPCDLDGSDF